MKRLLIIFLTGIIIAKQPKVLHLSFHNGCIAAVDTMAQDLGLAITHWNMANMRNLFEPLAYGNAIINITHAVANYIWEKNKAIFDTFDVIITSDTAPLSRIFLQNNWQKPLIVWICNRFDYADVETAKMSRFPDREYYSIMREASQKPNVFLVGNTEFEKAYAESKHIRLYKKIIKPYFKGRAPSIPSAISKNINKKRTFFIPRYTNDLFFLNNHTYEKLGIKTFRGYYSEPADLADFKGIIHIPYAYSTIAFFENLAQGIPYFIPTPEFLLKLRITNPELWHQNQSWLIKRNGFNLSEWYTKEHAPLFVYFNSWTDLQKRIQMTNYEQLRSAIKVYAKKHEDTMRKRWKALFSTFL